MSARSIGIEITGGAKQLKVLPDQSYVMDRTLDVHVKQDDAWYRISSGEAEDDPVEYELTEYEPLFLLRRGEKCCDSCNGYEDPGEKGNIYVPLPEDHDCADHCGQEHTDTHSCNDGCTNTHVDDPEHDCNAECDQEHVDDDHDCNDSCDHVYSDDHSCSENCDLEHVEVYYDSMKLPEDEQPLYINGDYVCERWEVPKALWSALTE